MNYLSDTTIEKACDVLRKAINAAENSNHNGEVFVVAAAHVLRLVDALSVAVAELEYFVDFARKQCEFEGDADAGLAAVASGRRALALAEGRTLTPESSGEKG